MATTEWTDETIRELLQTSDLAVEKGVVALFHRQTSDEKQTEATRHTNAKGFSQADAKKGSYYARWVMGKRRLTGYHLDRARKIIVKYRRQLLIVAAEKAISDDPVLTSLWKEVVSNFWEERSPEAAQVLDDALKERRFTMGIDILQHHCKQHEKKDRKKAA